MNRAVDGWRLRISSTFSPSSFPPDAGMMTPSTSLFAAIMHAGTKVNLPILGFVQPVNNGQR